MKMKIFKRNEFWLTWCPDCDQPLAEMWLQDFCTFSSFDTARRDTMRHLISHKEKWNESSGS